MKPVRALLLLALLGLSGCGLFSKDKDKGDAPAPAAKERDLLIVASSSANPDTGGRPSPVVVRVYVLASSAEFLGADFATLYGNEKTALPGGWVSREEALLAPGSSKAVKLAAKPEGRQLCALAAFREVRASQWRACADASGARAIRIDTTTVAIDSGG